jgi:hypothetical protein
MTHAAARCQRIEGLSANDYMAGVLSDQSDFAVPTVAYVAEKLGLIGNSIKTVIWQNATPTV